ncbi:uncharacterized protein LOC127724421 [Mytilus californianus]|uniref:uncharacterized protein LOC127724421 n=1 Tax=Mytilus californianus TaxID=6549 RepID=UPI002245B0E3|nr:uncharacterized protein LOC127724421 [Mytilus californianus]
MDTASGNGIHDISLNYVAQQPFVPKSFIQKMIAFFTQTTVIYMHPDVKVIQEGEILRVLVNKDSEGQSNIEITIPSNGKLQHFTRTQDITELKVLFGSILSRTENHVNTQNRIFNHNSDLELGNQACFTKKDYPHFETSKIPPRLDNTYIDTGNDYSNEDQPDESKTLYHRGFPVELVSYSTRKFHLNDTSSFLESVTFRKENRSRQRETLILFHLKGMLYSPSALMHLDMEDIEITNSIDILCISETERELRVEVLTGLNRYTAFEFAKLLQFLHNGQRVRKLKDLIPCLKLGDPKKDDPVFLERVKTENEGYIKTCFSLKQDLYGNHSQTSKNKDIEDTIAENIKKLQQEMSKVQQDLDLNMGATNGKIVGKNANAKCFTDSKWTDRKQVGNIKVRTQSDRPTWTICLQNPEDETEGVVSGYLGDPMISQAIYEFFGQYIDCGYTGSIERPPIPWPSMHPLLPYKCKYLDNRGS